ncbi:MAG TPA: hypothetical protein PLI18_11010, partial [Pirellulaceae bacterium]|nr:hypothetical protein [Pirellulaceae bacterium]
MLAERDRPEGRSELGATLLREHRSDLAEHLVSRGLARAFGVSRGTPSGLSREDYLALLEDLELRAAKKGTGIWAETDWDSLPAERSSQRKDEAEFQELSG